MPHFTSLRPLTTELKKTTDKGKVVLILCPDTIRRERAVEHVLKTIGANEESLTRHSLDGVVKDDFVKMKDELLSPSLFSPSTHLLFKNIEQLKTTYFDSLCSLFEHAAADTAIIIQGTKIPANSKIRKAIEKDHYILELPVLADAALDRWITAELKQHGVVDVPTSTINLLATIGEHSPDTIAGLVEQLALYTGSEKITDEDVSTLFRAVPHTSEFPYLDALIEGDLSKAEVLLMQLLRDGKNPFLIVSLLARSFQQYAHVTAASEKGASPAQIQEQLKIKPWLFSKIVKALKRYPKKKIIAAQKAILVADSRLKNKSLGPENILSELSYELCSAT